MLCVLCTITFPSSFVRVYLTITVAKQNAWLPVSAITLPHCHSCQMNLASLCFHIIFNHQQSGDLTSWASVSLPSSFFLPVSITHCSDIFPWDLCLVIPHRVNKKSTLQFVSGCLLFHSEQPCFHSGQTCHLQTSPNLNSWASLFLLGTTLSCRLPHCLHHLHSTLC